MPEKILTIYINPTEYWIRGGINYNFGYPGFPYTGILMMTVFAAILGIWLSYLTIRTKSVIAASIAHGTVNAIREGPAFVAVAGINTLLGPKPSGVIGMIGLSVEKHGIKK